MDTKNEYVEKTLYDDPATVLKDSLKLPLLSEEETFDLLKKAQKGDIDARNTLIERNMRLIYKYAGQYNAKSTYIDLSDFMSAGVFGMIKAIELFNFDAGTKFSTYAVIWIKQYMRRMVANEGNTIRIPVHLQESKYTLTKAINDYYDINNHYPSDKELLDFVNDNIEKYKPNGYHERKTVRWDMKKIKNVQNLSNYTVLPSLNAQVNEEDRDDSELQDFIQDDSPTPEQIFLHDDRMQDILRIIHRYVPNERARRIIFNRYGFNSSHEGMTLDAIGKMEGITRERVRQIIQVNLERLKESGALDDYRQDIL